MWLFVAKGPCYLEMIIKNYNFTVPHHLNYILTGHLLHHHHHHHHHLPLPRHGKVLLLVVSVEIINQNSDDK